MGEAQLSGSESIKKHPPFFQIRELRRFALEHPFTFWGGVVLPLALWAVFNAYPIVRTISLSLFKWDGLSPTMEFVGLQNFIDLVKDPIFRPTLLNNLKWAIFTLVFPVGGGLLLAIILQSKKIYFSKFFRTLFFLPATMSMATVGIVFRLILNPSFGGVNQLLRSIGLQNLILDWLGDPNVALYVLIAVFGWYYLGTPMVLFFAGIGEIPTELIEAADMEGVNFWQKIRYVTFPMLKPVTVITVALAIIQSLKAFDLVMVMTRGGPANATSVLGYMMYKESFLMNQFGYGAAVSVVILLLSVGFAAIYFHEM